MGDLLGEDINGFHDQQTENENNGHRGDEGDALGSNRIFFGQYIAEMPTERYATHYKMDHKSRGRAIIFNHEVFEMPTLKRRSGTAEDCNNLKDCLNHLGFDVVVHEDLKYHEIEKFVSDISKADHTESDCIVVVVLSHGEQGIIYAKDTCYKPDFLWSSFTPDKCPSLAGKPKIFFLQACQGDRLDGGVTLIKQTETDGHCVNTYKIPLQADFLIVSSTVRGYYSWRNTTKGSWFVQALCKELKERAFTDDLVSILTYVSQHVALDFESNVPDSPTMHQQKQIPCVMSMLTRFIKFTSKTGSDSESKIVHTKEKSKKLFSGFFQSKGKHAQQHK